MHVPSLSQHPVLECRLTRETTLSNCKEFGPFVLIHPFAVCDSQCNCDVQGQRQALRGELHCGYSLGLRVAVDTAID